jgi:hypothetical protein
MSIKIENFSKKLTDYDQSKPVFLKSDGLYTGEAVEMSSWRSGSEAILTTCGKIGALDFVLLAKKKCPELIVEDKEEDSVEIVMGVSFNITVKGGIMTNLTTGEAKEEAPVVETKGKAKKK